MKNQATHWITIMSKRGGNDLEDEMSRFEQELLAGGGSNKLLPLPLPPPPKTTKTQQDTTDKQDHRQPQARHQGLRGPILGGGYGGPIPRFGPGPGPMAFPMMPPMGHPQMMRPPQMGHGILPHPSMPPMPMPPMPPMSMPPMSMPSMGSLPMMPMMPMPPGSSSGSSSSADPAKIQYQSVSIKPPTVPVAGYATGDLSNLLQDQSQQSMAQPSGSMGAAGSSEAGAPPEGPKKKKFVRIAGGTVWEDQTLDDWDSNDFRLFVGDIGNEVTDDALLRAFNQYPSLLRAKIIRDKKTKKTKGYGFVSFKDPQDYLKAMKEMNGKYVGNRPIKLRKSSWKDRNINIARKKEKEKKKLGIK